MPRLRVPLLSTALLLLAASTLFGCEEDIAHPPPYDKPFSIYGVLSPQLPWQSILVYPIETGPALGSPVPLDAAVTSKDLTTGETYTWRDSARINAKGLYTHAFWAPFRAEYGHRYRIEVTRPSDGERAVAETRVPAPVTVQVDRSQSPDLYLTIEGEGIQVLKPEVIYTLQKPPYQNNIPYPILSYTISYEGRQEQVANGWMVHVRMNFDKDKVQSWYNLDAPAATGLRCKALRLRDFRFRAVVGDSIWSPPGGILDPKILSHPGVMDNVENGFGFVGAGYRIDEDLNLPPSAVEDACFIYFAP